MRFLPDEKFDNLPCSLVAIGCAKKSLTGPEAKKTICFSNQDKDNFLSTKYNTKFEVHNVTFDSVDHYLQYVSNSEINDYDSSSSLRQYYLHRGNYEKFQDPDLRKMLLETGDAEIIDNSHEDYEDNNLGKTIMHVREMLRRDDVAEFRNDFYMTLQGFNKLIRSQLKVCKSLYYKKNERISLAQFLETNTEKCCVCVLGHYLFADKQNYWSFFNNEEDPVVNVWFLRQ